MLIPTGLGGDAADLDVAESQRGEAAWNLRVLVESGRDAHGIRKLVPERLDVQARVIHSKPVAEEVCHWRRLYRP